MVDFLIKNGASTDPVVIKADPSFSFTDHKDFVKVIDISIQDEALKNKIKIN